MKERVESYYGGKGGGREGKLGHVRVDEGDVFFVGEEVFPREGDLRGRYVDGRDMKLRVEGECLGAGDAGATAEFEEGEGIGGRGGKRRGDFWFWEEGEEFFDVGGPGGDDTGRCPSVVFGRNTVVALPDIGFGVRVGIGGWIRKRVRSARENGGGSSHTNGSGALVDLCV